jgi:hypothetical protein
MRTSPPWSILSSCDEPGRRLNYARRQQYRRLSRAALAAMASGATGLLALAVASAGAISAAGVILVLSLGGGLYAHHWLSLAERSRVGARAEDEVRRALAPLQAEGWRLRHSLPSRGRGDVDSLAIAPTRVGFAVETKCAARRPVVSPVQPGGTRREVFGSNGLPGSER